MATRRRVLLLVPLLAAAGASLFAGVVLGLLAPDASPGLPWLPWVVAGSTTRTATRPATCC